MMLALFGLLIVIVSIWTWESTRPETSDGRETIVFWNAKDFGTEVYAVIHKFEIENPHYKVVVGSTVSRDLAADGQRLLCAVAGNVPPDLVLFDRYAIGEWAGRGALTDLDPYLDKQDKHDKYYIDRKNYYDWSMQEATYKPPGTNQKPGLYGVPTGIDIRLLYSNTGELRQKDIAHPPTTWNQLREDARLLTIRNPDGTIKQLGFAPNFGNSWLYIYAFQAGGHFLNELERTVNGKTYPPRTLVTMDDPEVVRALRFMTDVYDDAGGVNEVDKFKSGFQSDSLDPFIRGQIAMKIDGDWGLQTIATWNRDLNFEITPAPMPDDLVAKGVPPITWAGGGSMVIPSTAKNKAGAFKLMQYMLSPATYRFLNEGDRQAMESQGQLYLPRPVSDRRVLQEATEKYITHNDKMPGPFKRAYVVIDRMLDQTYIRPPSPVGQLLWNKHIDAMNDALAHESWAGKTDAQKNAEIKADLSRNQVDVQRRLDEIVEPPPPHEVGWGIYFTAYGLLVALPFVALVVAVRRGRKYKTYRSGQSAVAMLFLSPWLIGMICLTAGPILFSVVLSFTRYDVIGAARYSGFDNYRHLLTDSLFFKSLGNTAYMLLRVPLTMALSLGIAMLLNQKVKAIGAYRTIFYMPTIVPLVAASLLWLELLNDNHGLINVLIRSIETTPPARWIEALVNSVHAFPPDHPFRFTTPGWLVNAAWCKPSMILMALWAAGGGMIIWLAGLQSIPAQLYEAATVDGANKWKQFLHVTLPMLSPYILFNAIMGVIGTMQLFNEAYIIFPSGGANNSGLFYAFYLFEQAFQFFNMGYASAMAWVLFLIVLVLTLIQLYASKKWVNYDQT
jgi:ABC-type sugar transport system permease subunit/ABC-type glycerol-3-phosphate transport system substrate-binding protein